MRSFYVKAKLSGVREPLQGGGLVTFVELHKLKKCTKHC